MIRKNSFFEECSWFKFNNLGVAGGMVLKFTPVLKRVKTKSQKVLRANSYVCRSFRGKTGLFATHSDYSYTLKKSTSRQNFSCSYVYNKVVFMHCLQTLQCFFYVLNKWNDACLFAINHLSQRFISCQKLYILTMSQLSKNSQNLDLKLSQLVTAAILC